MFPQRHVSITGVRISVGWVARLRNSKKLGGHVSPGDYYSTRNQSPRKKCSFQILHDDVIIMVIIIVSPAPFSQPYLSFERGWPPDGRTEVSTRQRPIIL